MSAPTPTLKNNMAALKAPAEYFVENSFFMKKQLRMFWLNVADQVSKLPMEI